MHQVHELIVEEVPVELSIIDRGILCARMLASLLYLFSFIGLSSLCASDQTLYLKKKYRLLLSYFYVPGNEVLYIYPVVC